MRAPRGGRPPEAPGERPPRCAGARGPQRDQRTVPVCAGLSPLVAGPGAPREEPRGAQEPRGPGRRGPGEPRSPGAQGAGAPVRGRIAERRHLTHSAGTSVLRQIRLNQHQNTLKQGFPGVGRTKTQRLRTARGRHFVCGCTITGPPPPPRGHEPRGPGRREMVRLLAERRVFFLPWSTLIRDHLFGLPRGAWGPIQRCSLWQWVPRSTHPYWRPPGRRPPSGRAPGGPA